MLEVKGQKGEWWIEGVPAYEVDGETHTSCGPYATKDEAESDRRGLERTLSSMEKGGRRG